MKKFINIIVNILIVLIMIVASLITIVSLNTKKFGISTIGDIVPITISSENMQPTLKKDDLAITKVYSKNEQLVKGDIITFLTFKDYKTIVDTKRIYRVINDGGLISYETRGDSEIEADVKLVWSNDIISYYTGNKVKYAGKALAVLRNKNIFFLTVILPLFAIIGYFTFELFSKDED